MKNTTLLLAIMLLFGAFAVNAFAFPNTISYQGQLSDDEGSPLNENITATFTLYDNAVGGTAVWSEEQSFEVSDGIFNIELGSVENLDDVDFSSSYWLSIHIDGEAMALDPRVEITSVPYATNAQFITNGEINSTSIGNESAGAATFTTLSATGNTLDASSATISAVSVDLSSSTMYIPNSVGNGLVLTSDGSGKASWVALPSGVDLSGNETITGNWVNTANPWADDEVANDLTIDGGSIENTAIGDATPAGGTFTSLAILVGATDGEYLRTDANGNASWESIPSGVDLSGNETITGNWVNTANPWADDEVANDLTIDGGSIENTAIGDATPAGGTFTSLAILAGATDGHVLTSDANGNATWEAATGGGGGSGSANVSTNLRMMMKFSGDWGTGGLDKAYFSSGGTTVEDVDINGLSVQIPSMGSGTITRAYVTTESIAGSSTLGLHKNRNETAESTDIQNMDAVGESFRYDVEMEVDEDDVIHISFDPTTQADRVIVIIYFEYTRDLTLGADVSQTFTDIETDEFTLTTGASDGHVLTSDADGNATWEAAAGGGGNPTVNVISSNTTLTTDTQIIRITTSGITVTMPASPATGQIVYVSSEHDDVTVDGNGIDFRQAGNTAGTFLTAQYEVILIYNGTNWAIVD